MKHPLSILLLLFLASHWLLASDTVSKGRFFGISPTTSTLLEGEELAYYQEMGLKSIRIHLQRQYSYEAYDEIIATCLDNDIEVMMLVSYESYPSTSETINVGWGPIAHYTNYMELLETLESAVPYFRDRGVRAWEIWNEANGSWHLYADEFAELMAGTYERFKYTDQWDPGATIVFGGIDAVGAFQADGSNGAARQWASSVFASAHWTAFHEQYGVYPYDAMSIHPYYTYTPEKFNFNIRDVVLRTMDAYGDSLKPVWITELGTKEADPDMNADILESYVRTAFDHPRIERFFQFKYTYLGTAATTSDHNYFSLVEKASASADPVYKPAWFRYRDLCLELTPGRDLVVDSIWMWPSHPHAGDSVEIRALVHNRGDTATLVPAEVYFEIDSLHMEDWTASARALLPGEKDTVLMGAPFIVPPAPFRVRVLADHPDHIPEKNEHNNALESLLISDNISLSYKGGNGDSLHFIIQMEDYDTAGEGISYHDATAGNEGGAYRNDDVGIEESSGGGYNVGWINPGEWLQYSDIRGADTSYMVYARVASINNENAFHLELDGERVSKTLGFLSTRGWQEFIEISLGTLRLDTGMQRIRFVAESELFNMDYLRFSATAHEDSCCESGADSTLANLYHIAVVEVDSFLNESMNDPGYGNYLDLRIPLVRGAQSQYRMVLESEGEKTATGKWNAWIDFDHSLSFEDSERIILGKMGSEIQGTFRVPVEADTGLTRMRISVKTEGYAPQPCERFSGGEVEDYLVHIAPEVSTVGMDLLQEKQDAMKIFPNPAGDRLTLEWPGAVSGTLSILDMNGREIYREHIQSVYKHQINLDACPSGIYILLFNSGGTIRSRRFIRP